MINYIVHHGHQEHNERNVVYHQSINSRIVSNYKTTQRRPFVSLTINLLFSADTRGTTLLYLPTGTLLLTRINFNFSMDTWFHPLNIQK